MLEGIFLLVVGVGFYIYTLRVAAPCEHPTEQFFIMTMGTILSTILVVAGGYGIAGAL